MNSNFNPQNDENELDLGRILRFLLLQSKMIVFTVLIVFSVSFAIYITSTKYYKVTSLLQVDSSSSNIFGQMDTLYSNPYSSQSDINNLITLYESRTNILKLIEDLDLNVFIDGKHNVGDLDIDITELKTPESDNIVFNISFAEDGLSLLDEDKNFVSKISQDQSFEYKNLLITIKPQHSFKNKIVEIKFITPSQLFNKYKGSIDVKALSSSNNFFNRDGLIEVSTITDDVEQAKKIINYANKIFLDYRISLDTEKARRAIVFINKNIDSLKEVVEKNKNKLKEFRENNKSINVDLEIKAIIQNIQNLDSSISEIELELANASDVYTKSNPIYLNLQNRKNILINQRDEILSKIKQLPKEQQEYIDLFKDVEISQNLFEELEERRLSFSILEASTISNIRVVDQAFEEVQVSPSLINVIISSFLALVGACIFAIIRGFNYLPITNPAELFDNNVNESIIGVLPYVDGIKDAPISAQTDSLFLSDSNFRSSIESMIVNLKSVQATKQDSKVIAITSASAFNGKSTISLSLSSMLSELGNKVLLIDGDFKRGKIHKSLNIKSISDKSFFSIGNDNYSDIKIEDNLFFIPRIKNLDNSFHFVSSNSYQDKINQFKEEFDFIIIDTAPILAVSDTSMLLRKSHMNFLVVRHELSKINEVKQAIQSTNQLSLAIDGIIYNSYSRPKGYYGYYGLYGNYSYQYYAERYLNDEYYNKE